MCLTLEALVVFLNLIGTDMVAMSPDRIVVHATAGEVHWVSHEDRWCTMAPQMDRMARLADVTNR